MIATGRSHFFRFGPPPSGSAGSGAGCAAGGGGSAGGAAAVLTAPAVRTVSGTRVWSDCCVRRVSVPISALRIAAANSVAVA